MQRMERDFRLFTMESGRNLCLITIPDLTSHSGMEARELLHFLCICKPLFSGNCIMLCDGIVYKFDTVFDWRSDVEEGGETVFPAAKPMKFSSVPWWNVLSKFRRKGLSVKPKMGDALLFWSIRPDGTLDKSSLHGMDLLCWKYYSYVIHIYMTFHFGH